MEESIERRRSRTKSRRPFKICPREIVGKDGRPTIDILTDELPQVVQRYLRRIGHFMAGTKLHSLEILRQLDESQASRGKRLEDLTKEDVMAYYEKVEARNVRPTNAVARIIVAKPRKGKCRGSGFADFLASEGIITESEFERIRDYLSSKVDPPRPESTKRVALTREQEAHYKAHADRMMRYMMWFAADAPFPVRVSELIGVRISDIDFRERTITFYIKPRRKRHVLPFNDQQERILRNIIVFREIYAGRPVVHDFLFCTCTGQRWILKRAEACLRHVREEAEACGNPECSKGVKTTVFLWHVLRYTGARREYDRTHDILHVRDLLGHASVQMTERYLAISDEERLGRLRGYLK